MRTATPIAALAAALVAAAPAAGATGNRPGPKPANELVAYERAPGSNGAQSSIWVMTGIGRERRDISHTPAGASDTAPSVSLGSGVMAWQRTAGGPPQIFGGDVFGDTPSQISNVPGGATEPAMSRDVQIVASVHAGTDCELWVLDYTDPAKQRRLTDHGGGPGCDSAPAWSPDGKRVAFRRTAGGTTSFMVVPAEGGTPTPLQVDPVMVSAFAWSPGRELLLLTATDTPTLIAVGTSGANPRRLASGAALLGTPAWGPQSTWLTAVERQPDGSTDIVTVDGDGGPVKNVTNTPGVSEGHPSPAYPSNQGNGVGPGVHAHSLPARPHRRKRTRAVVATAAAAGLYVGHTNQRAKRYGQQRLADNEVSFRVSGGKVRGFAIPWLARCLDDYHGALDAPLIDRSGFDPLRLRGGRFSIKGAGYSTVPGPGQKADISLVLKGVVRGRRASGTLTVRASIAVDEAYIANQCGTNLGPRFGNHPIRWRATLRG